MLQLLIQISKMHNEQIMISEENIENLPDILNHVDSFHYILCSSRIKPSIPKKLTRASTTANTQTTTSTCNHDGNNRMEKPPMISDFNPGTAAGQKIFPKITKGLPEGKHLPLTSSSTTVIMAHVRKKSNLWTT